MRAKEKKARKVPAKRRGKSDAGGKVTEVVALPCADLTCPCRIIHK